MKSRFDFNSVSEITGIFVVLTALTVVALLTMTARVQRWFEPVFELMVELPNEKDLPAGASALQDASVLIDATTVGTVTEVHVSDSGDVTATLEMQSDLVSELRTDASAHLTMPFLPFLGVPSIKITKGTRGGPPLYTENLRKASLTSVANTDTDLQKQLRGWMALADQWERRAVKWEGYFEEWNSRMLAWEERMVTLYDRLDKELEEPNGRVIVFLDRLNLLMDRLANEGLLEWATRDPDWNAKTQAIVDNMSLLLSDTSEFVDLAQALLAGEHSFPPPFDEALAELPEMAKRITQMLKRVEGIVTQVELASASFPVIATSIEEEVRSIPGFLIESQEALRQIEILVRGIQKHWLLRSYVDPRPSKGRIPIEEVVGPMGVRE
ncbi:MAG: hypothetical protein ACI841_004574 [Planctomycetota bacterium]|jgi:hypothetical protein